MTLRREASVAMNMKQVGSWWRGDRGLAQTDIPLFQNLKDGFTPNIKRMQNLAKPQTLHVSESGVGLLRESSEYEMGNLRRDDSFNMWTQPGVTQ